MLNKQFSFRQKHFSLGKNVSIQSFTLSQTIVSVNACNKRKTTWKIALYSFLFTRRMRRKLTRSSNIVQLHS